MKVIVAGAGIGGLTAALCLLKAGHEVRVLERAAEFQDVGAGIQCGANALHVMQYLGISEQLLDVGVVPKRVEFRDFQSGGILHSMQLGSAYEQRYGAQYLHIHRSDLHQVLLSAVLEYPAASLGLGSCIESFNEHDDSVEVCLSNGQRLQADLLVGADGIKSVVRKQLFGDMPPVFTGNVAWRGVVPVERLPDNWMDTVVSNFVGPNKHMVLYYLRNKRLANFVGVVERNSPASESWVAKAPWEELANDFAGWHPIVQSLINAVDKEHCYRWGLYKHEPINNWSSRRVTLIGDAAHSTLPFMASGAAMAIEDARVLQRALDQANTLENGLQLCQRNRFDRTAKIQANSARAGSLYHFESSLMRRAAFTALKIVSKRQEAFLPDYNANTVRLR